MKQFKYKARKSPTETTEGTLAAVSQDDAVEQINRLGLLPIEIEEFIPTVETKKTAKPQPGQPAAGTRPARIKPRELTVFYKQLKQMIKSGMPILSSLEMLSRQEQSSGMKKIMQEVTREVREGQPLSAAFSAFGMRMSSFETALIRAGESVGHLDESLAWIVGHREKQEELTKKVRSALTYPVLVSLVGAGTVLFMLAFVIPRFAGFFSDLGQELPWPTRFLIALSRWAEVNWIFVTASGIGLFFAAKSVMKNASARASWDRGMLKIPAIGKVLIMSEASRLARTIELLIKSGIPLNRAVEIAVPVLKNEAVKQELESSKKIIEQGGLLSDALMNTGMFPAFTIQLIKVGEESGQLSDTLREIADWYEQETADAVKTSAQLIEPLMMLFVGLILGFIIIAVLLPIFSMNALVS